MRASDVLAAAWHNIANMFLLTLQATQANFTRSNLSASDLGMIFECFLSDCLNDLPGGTDRLFSDEDSPEKVRKYLTAVSGNCELDADEFSSLAHSMRELYRSDLRYGETIRAWGENGHLRGCWPAETVVELTRQEIQGTQTQCTTSGSRPAKRPLKERTVFLAGPSTPCLAMRKVVGVLTGGNIEITLLENTSFFLNLARSDESLGILIDPRQEMRSVESGFQKKIFVYHPFESIAGILEFLRSSPH